MPQPDEPLRISGSPNLYLSRERMLEPPPWPSASDMIGLVHERLAKVLSASATLQIVTGLDDEDIAAVMEWVVNDPHQHAENWVRDHEAGSRAAWDFEMTLLLIAIPKWLQTGDGTR